MAHNVITDALVGPRIRFHLFRRKLTSNDARGATEAERECINVPWEREERPQSPSLSRGRHDRGRRGMKEMERKGRVKGDREMTEGRPANE